MWEDLGNAISESFLGLTPLLWVSQIAGLIGLAIIGISYLFKKKTFLMISTFSFIFFMLEQGFAFLWANLIVSFMCFVRNGVMFYYLWKKNEELPKYMMFSFVIIMWVLVLTYMGISNTFNVWKDYIPLLVVTMSTFTQNSKNEIVVKVGATLHEGGFLVFYIINRLPFSAMRQVILVIACLIGLTLVIIKIIKNRKCEELNVVEEV